MPGNLSGGLDFNHFSSFSCQIDVHSNFLPIEYTSGYIFKTKFIPFMSMVYVHVRQKAKLLSPLAYRDIPSSSMHSINLMCLNDEDQTPLLKSKSHLSFV